MKLMEKEPTFVKISWETAHPGTGHVVTFEATLCRLHRQELDSWHPAARGSRQLGDSCDLCEGRRPRRA